ncbi:MAG: PAS domain-containing protein [Candidatus Magasanikbacteria bacterium]
MHNTVLRQIKKTFGDPKNVPEQMEQFLDLVSQTYDHFDQDRILNERSLEINSEELNIINEQIQNEKKKIEELLFKAKEEKQKYKILTETSPDCIKLFDRNMRLLFINQSGLREHVLKDQKEAEKFDFERSIVPQDRKKFKEGFQAALRKKTTTFRVEHETKKCLRHACIETLVPIINSRGNVTMVYGVSRDISKQEEYEQRIQEQKELAEQYLDIVGSVIVALDIKGTVILLNKKGYEVLGYKDGFLEGKNWFEEVIPKEDVLQIKKIHWANCRRKNIAEHHENLIVGKNKKKILMSWYNTPIENRTGNIIGTLSAGENITEQRKMEIDLREKNEALQNINNLMVGRELKMIELKDKVKKLESEIR